MYFHTILLGTILYYNFKVSIVIENSIHFNLLELSIWRLFCVIYVLIVAIIIFILLGSLLMYSLWGIYWNETTFEGLKRSFLYKKYKKDPSSWELQSTNVYNTNDISEIKKEIYENNYSSSCFNNFLEIIVPEKFK